MNEMVKYIQNFKALPNLAFNFVLHQTISFINKIIRLLQISHLPATMIKIKVGEIANQCQEFLIKLEQPKKTGAKFHPRL